MLRKVLATVLLLGALSGCTVPARTCTSDADCQGNGGDGLCDTQVKLCYAGNKEIDNSACTPACAPYEACTRAKVCVPRYSALVVTPGDGGLVGKGAVPVRAELLVDTTRFTANFPETLRFSAVREDGGTGGTFDAVSTDAGVYTTQWTPSAGDGVFLLTAAYPTDGGPSTTVQLTVDATPPAFVVTVPVADAGVSTGGTTYADPGIANAWRRDQVVRVEIRTNEPNLDPNSLKVVLQGTDGGTSPGSPVTPFAQSMNCDAGFCGVSHVNLWEPPFNIFRGTMSVDVEGSDRVGNTSSISTIFNVTRWKWAFDGAAGSIRSSPAVGAIGTIYLGTNANTSGKVLALNPEGVLQWESQVGAVVGGPAVGAFDGGTELVYVGANSTNDGSLYALHAGDGGTVLKCTVPTSGTFEGSLALGRTGSTQLETAVSVYKANSGAAVIVGVRPGAIVPCPLYESPSTGEKIPVPSAGSSVVIRDEDIFFSGSVSDVLKITSYTFGSPTPRSNWPVNSPAVARNLVLIGSDVVGAAASSEIASGGLFKIPQVGATDVTRLYPPGPAWASRVFSLAVGGANNVFFGAEPPGSSNFNRLNLATTTTPQIEPSSFAIRATPIVGSSQTVYTVTTNGIVKAWAVDDLSERWALPASSALGIVDASPTLDCPRDATGAFVEGNRGILYVPVGGKLYAFVVDSRGLDPDAPWPKYQHDARNTGNPNTPISSCP